MDLGIVMRGEVLQDKRADGRAGRAVATWNTRRVPTRLTAGWTNRLFVACAGAWRGYFPLSGDVLWNPRDETAPYALIFDPRRWTPITAVPSPSFRGLALPGLTARRRGVAAHRGSMIASRRTTSYSKHSLKQMRDQALALLPPPATSTSPPPAVTPPPEEPARSPATQAFQAQ